VTTPPEITQTLLNLAEFMEHDDNVLRIRWDVLGYYAQKCHAWAKALHYKELECMEKPTSEIIEELIRINNALQQPDVAMGILTNAQQNKDIPLQEEWYEKLERWEDALASYERRSAEDPSSFELALGRMRCLHALAEWDSLFILAEEHWGLSTLDVKRKIAPLAAAAAWGLAKWERMDDYIGVLRSDSPDRAWLKAILHVHREEYAEAERQVGKARDVMVEELRTLLGESYPRAYGYVYSPASVQQAFPNQSPFIGPLFEFKC
jgi:serine/threonine-protein kinase mTOR